MVNHEAAEGMIELYCKALKMPTLRKGFRQILRDSHTNGNSMVEFLGSCLAHEIEGRHQSAMATRMKLAKFPTVKTLDSFDFAAVPTLDKAKILALADSSFIREHENLVLLGNSGLGKTHLAIALGVRAIQAGYRVRFITVPALVQELVQAEREFRLPKLLKSWEKVDLLIADELGYVGLGPGGPLLFQLLAQRYEKSSVIITSNLEFSRWAEVFGDVTMTAALLDRLTHHVHTFILTGQSYRLKQSKTRSEVTKLKDAEVHPSPPVTSGEGNS